jgi:hypothetical protein
MRVQSIGGRHIVTDERGNRWTFATIGEAMIFACLAAGVR